MRNLRISILATLIAVATTMANGQCALSNTAFKAGEKLSYNLYFNWKFVWVKAGTASMSVSQGSYKGQQALRASLTTRSSSKVDNMFVMRDTLLCYTTNDLSPLYYRKGAKEGKRYTVDEVWYSYPSGRCSIKQSRLHGSGRRETRDYASSECVYDMMSIFLRARNLNPASWKEGHAVDFPIADGNGTNQARLIYKGRKDIKADNGSKYRCLELSYVEKSKNKWKEIARFYVTDDANHVPVRLDMYLRFGSAKAYLTQMDGIKNAVTSKLK